MFELADYWVGTRSAAHYIMGHLFSKLDGAVKVPIMADICRLMSRFERPHRDDDLKEGAVSFR